MGAAWSWEGLSAGAVPRVDAARACTARRCRAHVMCGFMMGCAFVFSGAAQGRVRADGGQAAGDGGAAAGGVWRVGPTGADGAAIYEWQHATLRGCPGRGGSRRVVSRLWAVLAGPIWGVFSYWVLVSCLLLIGAPGACLCLRGMPTFGPRSCGG